MSLAWSHLHFFHQHGSLSILKSKQNIIGAYAISSSVVVLTQPYYTPYLSFRKRRSRLRMVWALQIKDRGIRLNYRSFHHKRLYIWNHSCKLPEQATMCCSFHTHWGNILQSVSHMIFLKSIRILFYYLSWKTIIIRINRNKMGVNFLLMNH